MKKLALLLFAASIFGNSSFSQDLKRYYDKIFSTVQIDSNIVYGNNFTYDILKLQVGLSSEDLALDVYYPPKTDSIRKRPLIIWAHGGSFLSGTKEDKDIVYFCKEFAKRGFVCASINYRLGYELPIDSVAAVRTVYRALQDGRAAVRYMRSVALHYGIDKERVYFGGTSAGAFIAANIAYLNLPEEVPEYVDTMPRYTLNFNLRYGLDGIEGLTNTIKQSSKIQGVINFCGATKSTSWMDDVYSSSIPIISMHGTNDGTVPYATRTIFLNDLTPIPEQIPLPIVGVKGSYDIDKHADEMGYTSKFYTWYGADHVPYINYDNDPVAAAYMDTLMSFTVKHVYEDFLGLGEVDGLDENAPPCDFNNGDTVPCLTAINKLLAVNENPYTVYPNPTSNYITIESETLLPYAISITNLNGQVVIQLNAIGNSNIDVSTLPQGSYIISYVQKGKQYSSKIEIIN